MRVATVSDDKTARLWDISRSETIVRGQALVLTAALAQGVGWRAEYERRDVLMQDAPEDMFSAAWAGLSDRSANFAEVVAALRASLHRNCYLSPTEFEAKFRLVEGRDSRAIGGLRRLREIMEESVSVQERLDKIVALIAANMIAEACSIYVLRIDNALELFASEGLNREAVHRTVLRPDEGLVGLVANKASPLNLSDAQSHPAFSHHRQTGEEIYNSFLGVPILRGGRLLGVLAVQNRAKRTYVEEEVEALQTNAMVLAEMLASGELTEPGVEPATRRSPSESGTIDSRGVAPAQVGHNPRVLLRRLREIMGEQVSAQERLDKIVVLIAANMAAEVCSTYVLRVDNTLELYATEGLNRGAVHRTVISAYEGLVGLVSSKATPLNLSDAQSHPAFSFRPETGEEIYHSFLGVPILRAGNTLGVLVVQNRAKRTYVEEEVEALQTTAMVLAEMIASGELTALAQPGQEPAVRHSVHKTGAILSDGIACGHVVLHEPRVVITNYIAEDLPKEIKRLGVALAKLRADLDRLLERGDFAEGGEHRDVLEAYRMFANDHGWSHRLHEAVATGLTAEAAVERVQSDTRARMLRSTDPYLRDRLHDLEDLGNRLMRQLVGQDHAPSREQLPDNAILIARAMGPAALLDYDRKRLRGLVLEEGTANSSVSIMARALGIPAVGEIPNAPGIADPGDAIIVDGTSGSVYVQPPAEIESAYAERVGFRALRQAQYRAFRDEPCVTKDGQPIELLINAGLVIDLPHIDDTGSAGIGLFRTELQFMVSSSLPRSSEQLALYRTVLDAAGTKPVTFRTLDIGGDKALPYLETVTEENPALGWRAIRLGLDRPGLLRGQIRALLRAGGGRALRIMFPMISEVAEFDSARAIIERELIYLRQHGHALPERLDIGATLEVPALLYQLDELLQKVDFLAVGSSDLFQFLFAVDRGNPRVSDRFDELSIPMLRALKEIAETCHAHGKEVTQCAEIASQPIGALALIALGYRKLSLTPSAVGPVKATVMELDAGKAEALVNTLMAGKKDANSIRASLIAFAEAEGIPL
jgi:phosphotransferase system enzyme I (PtsP)